MLVDRSPAEDVFARVPQMAQRIDPVLKELDERLPDDELSQHVRADFGKRYRSTLVHGRHSTPVEGLLRLLIVKHLHQWSYQDTQEQVDQNLLLRWFCRLYWAPVPDDTTLIRWANTLQPETLHALNDRVVQLAMQARITKGRKLRLDATCVQTNIHHPTHSGLLVDSVRVLSRFVQRSKGLVKDQVSNVQQLCRSRLLTARRTAQTLHRQLRRKGEDKEAEQKQLYKRLVHTAEQMVKQVKQVIQHPSRNQAKRSQGLREQAEQVLPLIERVIAQTRSRVLEGKKVASADKVLSLLEPRTRAILRQKGGALIEFGRQVILDEVEGGIVTRYWILAHPHEHGQATEAVEHHLTLFARPPNVVADDRGVHSAETEVRLLQRGVKQVTIPASGPLSQERQDRERSRAFRRGYRWRAGIEGPTASLRRILGGAKAAITGKTGWSGGWAWASNLRRIALTKEA